MKLQTFNGGIVTRIASNYIDATQAVECTNVDLRRGPLEPVKAPLAVIIGSGQYAKWYNTKNEWVTSDTWRDYIEYQGVLYWTQYGKAQQYDGTNTTNMGIMEPTSAPTILASGVGTGGQDGVYQYAYSYYNDLTGIESAISPLTDEVELSTASVTLNYVASDDPQVTHIRLYRIGGTWTDFLRVTVVPNSTGSFIDDLADEALDGSLMGSVLNTAPYDNLMFLTEFFGTFYGALDTKLYYTKGDGYPQYWPRTNYFEFFEPITSISTLSNCIVVFTKNSTSLIFGSDPTTYSLVVLDRSTGCINHACTVSTGSQVIAISVNGLIVVDSSGITLLSQSVLGPVAFDTVNAVWVNNCYYLQLTSGKVLCYDTRYGQVFYYLDFDSVSVASDTDEVFFILSDNSICKGFAGNIANYVYKTGVLTDGEYSNVKSYNKFYIRSNGSLVLTMSIDGEVVLTKELTGNTTHQLTPPQARRVGYGLDLMFEGTGVVYEVVYNVTFRAVE